MRVAFSFTNHTGKRGFYLSFFVAAPDLLSGRGSCSERSGELCGAAASPVRGSHKCGDKKDIAFKNLGFTEVFAIYTGKSGTFSRVKFLTKEVRFRRYFSVIFKDLTDSN